MRFAPIAWAMLVVLAASVFASEALAQEVPEPSVAASGRSFELGFSGGVSDGWGILTSGSPPSPPSVRTAGAGGQLELDAGLRVVPRLTLGVYGFGAQLSETAAYPSSADAFTAGAGLQGTVHFLPARYINPWVSLGGGWRGQWLTYAQGGFTALDGVDFFRARVGANLHVSPTVALSPVVGASLSTFLVEQVPGTTTWTKVQTLTMNTFIFVGARATLDFPLERRPARPTIASP